MNQKLFHKNFTLLLLGQITSLLGNFTLKFALSMYVLELTGSASVFGGLLALSMIPTIVLSPLGGILADRRNRRRLMIALDLLSGVSVLAAALLLSPSSSLWVVGILLVILSILGAFESPVVSACIPELLSQDQLISGNAAVNQAAAILSLVTPFLGSLLYSSFGIHPILYGTMACFFLTALLETLLRLPYRKPEKTGFLPSVIREDFLLSMDFLCRKEPDILRLLLLAGLVSLFLAGILVVGFPYLIRTVMGLSARLYGAAESAMGAAAILGSLAVALLAKRLRFSHLALIFLSFGGSLILGGFLFLLPIGVIPRYLSLILLFGACQFGCSIFSTYAMSVIQSRTPKQLMGKVMSYVFTLSLCAQPLEQLLYGYLFDRFSQNIFWILLLSGLVVCSIGFLSKGFFEKKV